MIDLQNQLLYLHPCYDTILTLNNMKMKRLKVLLLSLTAPLMLASCLDTGGSSGSGVSETIMNGISLYNSGLAQSVYSLDPTSVAFRLNALLTDREKQGVTTLDEVRTEAGNNEYKYLFGSTIIEEDYRGVPGDYLLTFAYTETTGQYDRKRDGSILISTGGHLLSELAETGGMWVIDLNRENGFYYPVETSGATLITVEGAEDYTISASDDGQGFNIDIKNFKSFILSNYTSDWTANYQLATTGATDFALSDLKKITFKLSGRGSGPTMYDLYGTQANLIYQISESVVYRPDCGVGSDGSVYKYSGEERVSFIEGSVYDQTQFPSSFVTVKFMPTSESCNMSVPITITYNGEVYTL